MLKFTRTTGFGRLIIQILKKSGGRKICFWHDGDDDDVAYENLSSKALSAAGEKSWELCIIKVWEEEEEAEEHHLAAPALLTWALLASLLTPLFIKGDEEGDGLVFRSLKTEP